MRLPVVEATHDIHCVTRWSRAACRWQGVAFPLLATWCGLCPRHSLSNSWRIRRGSTIIAAAVSVPARGRAPRLGYGWATVERATRLPPRVVAPSRYFYKSVKWVREIRFLTTDVLGYWERAGGYHNNADFWREERYVSGNLSPEQLERLRRTANFRPYRQQVLLSLDLSGGRILWCGPRAGATQKLFPGWEQPPGGQLRGANLTNSDLQGANLCGADLTAADLEGVLLLGADLRQCSMRGARLAAAEFWRPASASTGDWDRSARGRGADLLEEQVQFLRQQGVWPMAYTERET